MNVDIICGSARITQGFAHQTVEVELEEVTASDIVSAVGVEPLLDEMELKDVMEYLNLTEIVEDD